MGDEIVISRDPALLRAVLLEHYPDVIDRQVAIKELVYLGKLKQEDLRRSGPRTEPREAVRQAKEVGLTWRRAVEEGRTGSWSAQNDLPVVLGFAEKLLGGAPSATAKVLSTVVGLAQDAMGLTPVQDWFALESAVESSRWQRQLTISDLTLDDDINFITDSCLSDRLCATESTYVAPKLAGKRTEMPATPAGIVFEHGEVFGPAIRKAVRSDGTLVIDAEELKKELDERFGELQITIKDGTEGIRSELAAIRAGQETVLGWVAEQRASEAERHAAEERNARRTEIVREAEPVLLGAQGSLQVITSLMSLVDPKLAGEVARVGGAAIQVARAGVELVQVAANISTAVITGAVAAGAMAATGNFIGAAVALISLFAGGGPSDTERILNAIEDLRTDMRDLREDMSGRFDRIERRLDRIYADVMAAMDRIDLGNRRLSQKVDVVLAGLQQQREALTSVERNLLAYFREAEREELKLAMDTALGRPARSEEPEMTVAEYQAFEGEFYRWATERCQGNIESRVVGRDKDFASLATELTSPSASAADNLALVIAVAREREWPGAVNLPNRLIPNPDTWAVAASAFTQLESEWPELAARTNSADLDGRRKSVRLNGLFVREVLGGLVAEVDGEDRNSLMLACDSVANKAIELGEALERAAVDWEDELMRAEQAAHIPYVPKFTPPDAKEQWDYAPRIDVSLDVRGFSQLPPEMTRRMPATLRAVAGADRADALAVGRFVQEPGQEEGVVRAYVDVSVWPFQRAEGGDNQYPPDPGPPALRYSVRASAAEPAAESRSESLDKIWGADRWGREWSPALAHAEPVEVNWQLIDGLRPYVAGWQRIWREDPQTGLYPWLHNKLLSQSAPEPLATAREAYTGSRVLLDTLLTLAMPVQREYHDIVRATLDGLPVIFGGVGIPVVQEVAHLMTLREAEGGPQPGGAGEGRLANAVTRLTAQPLAVLRAGLNQYRKEVAAGTEKVSQPLLEQSLLRLGVSEGIVTVKLRVAKLDHVTPPRPPTGAETPENPKIYIVKRGDTLASIARTLRVPGGWRALYEANRDIIGLDPNMLKVGVKLDLSSFEA
ncbi:LysM peptidoglycan-binding domain-containing protein [Nakamurella sp. GG22]